MEKIVRFSTPTIKVTYKTIDPANISEAYLTVLDESTTVLTKEIAAAEIGDNYIAWTLSQSDTEKLTVGSTVKICCDWKLENGTRGRSVMKEYWVAETGVNEVI